MVLELVSGSVQIPKAPTIEKKAMESFEHFERDFDWKIYFAGEKDEDFNIKSKSKLYRKSANRPTLSPQDIGLGVINLKIAIRIVLAIVRVKKINSRPSKQGGLKSQSENST